MQVQPEMLLKTKREKIGVGRDEEPEGPCTGQPSGAAVLPARISFLYGGSRIELLDEAPKACELRKDVRVFWVNAELMLNLRQPVGGRTGRKPSRAPAGRFPEPSDPIAPLTDL
jgi:hypothetical protein